MGDVELKSGFLVDRKLNWRRGLHEYVVKVSWNHGNGWTLYVDIAVVEVSIGCFPSKLRDTRVQKIIKRWDRQRVGTSLKCKAAITYLAALELRWQLMHCQPSKCIDEPLSVDQFITKWVPSNVRERQQRENRERNARKRIGRRIKDRKNSHESDHPPSEDTP